MSAPLGQQHDAINNADTKYEEDLHEEAGGKGAEDLIAAQRLEHALAVKPASLQNLTDHELQELDKRMVRKMDLIILPIIGVLYILNYIDRQNLAAAKLQGVMDDLKMTEDMFATAIAILFAGYIPFQIPSNLLISRISRPGLYICCATVLWGSVSTATAAVQTYPQLLAVRVLLGVTEAVFFPGVIYYLSAWYIKKELGKRLAGLFIAQQLGNAFGGLIAAGVLSLNGAHGIRGWRWLFIIEGVATIGFGIIFAFVMPEYPHKAKMLKPIERDYAVWRLECEAGAGEANENIGTWQSFRMALTDKRIYTLIFCMMMAQGMGSITNFFPAIVGSLGYSPTISLLLVAPPYLFACFIFWGVSWYSDRKHTIYPVFMGCLGFIVLVYIIPLATTATAGRYFAMMLIPGVGVAPQIMLYKTMNLHVARPYTKRAAGVALMNAIGGTSNIWGSYLWKKPPRYYEGFGTMMALAISFMIAITGYRFFVRSQNRKLESGPEGQAIAMKNGVTKEMVDMGWRYECY